MGSPTPVEPIPQPQARTLLTSFTTFITLTIHTVLYHRRIYPAETFLLAKHHNLPVHQSRHPGLCKWINDSVTQVRELLAHGRLARVSINLHQSKSLQVVERWVFDVSSFPAWVDEEAERNRQAAAAAKGKGKEVIRPLTWEEREMRERRRHRVDEQERDELERQGAVNWTDVDESIRGALRRIAYAAEAKGPMQDGTFTIAVELRDSTPDLLVQSQNWIPSQPEQQGHVPIAEGSGAAVVPKTTTPLRTVYAGPLFFECWVEEAEAKEGHHTVSGEATLSQDDG